MDNKLALLDLQTETDHETVLTGLVRLPAALDFEAQLGSLRDSGARDLLDSFNEAGEVAWVERPVQLGGRPFLLRLTEGDSNDQNSFVRLRLQADDSADRPPTPVQAHEALQLASRRFWWELDMDATREALVVNEYGEDLVARFWPHRPANMAGPWEGLLKTVISVQIYPGLATRLQQALLDFYSGPPFFFDGKPYHFYPTVEQVAEIEPDDLLGVKFSRQKARYLPGIAQMLLAQPDRYNWERLRSLPGPEAVAILDELPGVGVWTSNYVAMRGLPHQDVFIDEVGLKKVLAAGFGKRPEMSSEEAAKLTEVYSPYRSIACYYSYMKMYT